MEVRLVVGVLGVKDDMANALRTLAWSGARLASTGIWSFLPIPIACSSLWQR